MHAARARCLRYCEELPLLLPPLRAAGGEGEGWPQVSLAVIRMGGDDNRNGNCLSKKDVGQGKRTGGIKRWVCFFMLSYFIIVFWLIFFNAG